MYNTIALSTIAVQVNHLAKKAETPKRKQELYTFKTFLVIQAEKLGKVKEKRNEGNGILSFRFSAHKSLHVMETEYEKLKCVV